MGMAASQARYLALSARKSNVEYEGQQINQARTALANESSQLWNELYSMEVPTAPSTTDYTTTQYSFENGDTTQTISEIQDADYTDVFTLLKIHQPSLHVFLTLHLCEGLLLLR